ncbi:hypothetical protein ACEUAY_21255 [Aeromonas veronii]
MAKMPTLTALTTFSLPEVRAAATKINMDFVAQDGRYILCQRKDGKCVIATDSQSVLLDTLNIYRCIHHNHEVRETERVAHRNMVTTGFTYAAVLDTHDKVIAMALTHPMAHVITVATGVDYQASSDIEDPCRTRTLYKLSRFVDDLDKALLGECLLVHALDHEIVYEFPTKR